jgi:hypothetical protein
MTTIALGEAYDSGAMFACHTCPATVKVPTAEWANNFTCIHCKQEYQRQGFLPEILRDELFGTASPYSDFGSF